MARKAAYIMEDRKQGEKKGAGEKNIPFQVMISVTTSNQAPAPNSKSAKSPHNPGLSPGSWL